MTRLFTIQYTSLCSKLTYSTSSCLSCEKRIIRTARISDDAWVFEWEQTFVISSCFTSPGKDAEDEGRNWSDLSNRYLARRFKETKDTFPFPSRPYLETILYFHYEMHFLEASRGNRETSQVFLSSLLCS